MNNPNIKKILYVEQNHDGTVGGSQYCLLELVSGIEKSRYEPIIIFYEYNHLIPQFEKVAKTIIVNYPKSIKLIDVDTKLVGKIILGSVQRVINYFRRVIVQTIKWILIIKKNNIDLVHLNNASHIDTGWTFAAKITGVRCVTHQRGYPPKKIRRKIKDKYDAIIAISDQIKECLIENNPKLASKIIRIYDGIDARSIVPNNNVNIDKLINNIAMDDDVFMIGMVGNIKRWKGQEVLLNACSILRNHGRNFHCIFIGAVSNSLDDMQYYLNLERYRKNESLEKYVTFLGSREDALDIMYALDVVVHASIDPEPLGRVIFEAMALGKAVISTNCGGPREIIVPDITGILIEPNDSSALAKEIERLIDNRSEIERLGREAIKHVVSNFSIEKSIADIEAVYRSLLCKEI